MTCKALKYGVTSYVIIGVEIWEDTSLESSFPPKDLRLFTNKSNVSCYKDHLHDELQGATDCCKPLQSHHITYKFYCDVTPISSYWTRLSLPKGIQVFQFIAFRISSRFQNLHFNQIMKNINFLITTGFSYIPQNKFQDSTSNEIMGFCSTSFPIISSLLTLTFHGKHYKLLP